VGQGENMIEQELHPDCEECINKASGNKSKLNDGVRRKEFFEEATKLFDKYCKSGTLETDKDSKTIGSFVGMQEYYYCLNELIDKFA
jgi:hypothetical protein